MKSAMFTTQERKNILQLLSRAVKPDDALNIEDLHGFLFGLAIIPELIKPSEWLPVVFGEEMMEFGSQDEVEKMMGHLFGIWNRLQKENAENKLRFPFDLNSLKNDDIERMEDWANGLYLATSLRPEVWGFDDEGEQCEENITGDMQELSSAFGVIMGVAQPELIPEIFEKPGFDPEANKKDRDLRATLFALLPNAVETVQEYARLKAEEYQGGMPLSEKSAGDKREKIGRNDPCPCGSGKKHKKCCGMNS